MDTRDTGARLTSERLAFTEPGTPVDQSQPPLHRQVFLGLAELIEQQVLPEGLVLLEGPIASYFGVSRIPVRQALSQLAESGSIRTFHGRGYLVDPSGRSPPPLRSPFRSLDLPSRSGRTSGRVRKYEWQRVYDEIASEIAQCLLFGTYQIREARLCARYAISRTVVREVLARLMARGVIEKDQRSHWICGPFTAKANREQYQMRMILEIAALKACAEEGLLPDIGAMLARLDDTVARPASVPSMIVALENDLHGSMFERCTNDRLKAMIVRNQLCLNVNRTFYRHFGASEEEPMLAEHREVLLALHSRKIGDAQVAMRAHLSAAWERSQARLKVLAVIDEPHPPDFLERTH